MQVKHFAMIIACLIFITVIEHIRRQKLTFKYSMYWLTGSLAVIFLAFYDKILYPISTFLGFQLTSNFIFFLVLIFFVFLSFFLTVYISEQNARTETLAQAIAMLEFQINELKKKLSK